MFFSDGNHHQSLETDDYRSKKEEEGGLDDTKCLYTFIKEGRASPYLFPYQLLPPLTEQWKGLFLPADQKFKWFSFFQKIKGNV